MAKSLQSGARKPAPARRNGVRELGALLPDVAGVAFRRFGFSQSALVARWSEIVGPVYAGLSTPESLRFSRGKAGGATLTVRAEGAVALQLQHIAPQLVERVNRLLGSNTVERLRLVQGELPVRPAPPRASPAPEGANLAPLTMAALAAIGNDGLRQALLDLAAQLQARDGPPEVH